MTEPDIQAFVFNWPGHEQDAMSLQHRLAAFVPTTVINSDDGVRGRASWVDVGGEAYFSAQWNAALERFDGDLLFHLQADARIDDPGAMLRRVRSSWMRHRLGIYEPNVDYTDVRYPQARLRPLEPDLLCVPLTDCTCWAVSGDVVRAMPPVDAAENRYGWGICAVVAAISRRLGRPCARDYSQLVRHPPGRGYSSTAALAQRRSYFSRLPPDLAAEVRRIYWEVAALQQAAAAAPETRR